MYEQWRDAVSYDVGFTVLQGDMQLFSGRVRLRLLSRSQAHAMDVLATNSLAELTDGLLNEDSAGEVEIQVDYVS